MTTTNLTARILDFDPKTTPANVLHDLITVNVTFDSGLEMQFDLRWDANAQHWTNASSGQHLPAHLPPHRLVDSAVAHFIYTTTCKTGRRGFRNPAVHATGQKTFRATLPTGDAPDEAIEVRAVLKAGTWYHQWAAYGDLDPLGDVSLYPTAKAALDAAAWLEGAEVYATLGESLDLSQVAYH
ncbi:hypothetical protein [Deinococcus ficus]|uniref:Uncharacterized protein n=1 Tax=Deinococcus ficus TaxID=317577 RepID=A0A221T357_9DEIO|nr:hypothetical protein [Deinococcus ficus]ASN83276.1 hypothetical protein DFI_18940 [Deinococcus ficus]